MLVGTVATPCKASARHRNQIAIISQKVDIFPLGSRNHLHVWKSFGVGGRCYDFDDGALVSVLPSQELDFVDETGNVSRGLNSSRSLMFLFELAPASALSRTAPRLWQTRL